MPKVSVLMNCFNGEKYLKKAIDSVFNQTFTDWELVFVDNCSTDNSVKIATSYGDKVRIISTQENIPLGGARNFGISSCEGAYVSFLDVDDIWFPQAIEKQLEAITSGDFALSYGGHININDEGIQIGKMMPKPNNGIIFSSLLKQYDIPIVTTMVSKKHLLDSGLEFDSNVYASEEYCLFMQLAANYSFISINEYVTQYRIHDGALTNKTISVWAEERRYTLNKIIKENEGIDIKYKDGFDEAFARASYYEAQYLMSTGHVVEATRVMGPHRTQSFSYFIIYILLKFGGRFWGLFQRIKYGRNI